MNFVFENFKKGELLEREHVNYVQILGSNIGNFLDKNIIYPSTDRRFNFSEFVCRFFEENQDKNHKAFFLENKPDKYVISTKVAHHPDEWAGKSYSKNTQFLKQYNYEVPDLFDLLNETFLDDLRNKRALFVIDQTHEGYQTDWLWDFFHSECERYKINPSAIVYCTGNQDAPRIYEEWIAHKNFTGDKIKVLPVAIFEKFIVRYHSHHPISFDEVYNYKAENGANIYLYDCLNRNIHRPHRVANFLNLLKHDLHKKGYITMPAVENFSIYGFSKELCDEASKILPLTHKEEFVEGDQQYSRVLKKLYLNTWVSLVTEASYYNIEQTIFISEKIFKPILCLQPFIVVGSQGTLKKLRDLGYKTFHPLIDESYDNEYDDKQRFNKIIESLKQIDSIENKLEWFEKMRPILEHNRDLLIKREREFSQPFLEFMEYYDRYFQ